MTKGEPANTVHLETGRQNSNDSGGTGHTFTGIQFPSGWQKAKLAQMAGFISTE